MQTPPTGTSSGYSSCRVTASVSPLFKALRAISGPQSLPSTQRAKDQEGRALLNPPIEIQNRPVWSGGFTKDSHSDLAWPRWLLGHFWAHGVGPVPRFNRQVVIRRISRRPVDNLWTTFLGGAPMEPGEGAP